MKKLAEAAIYTLYKYTGVMRAQECIASWSGRRYMAILLLHRVTDAIPEDGLTVTTKWFREFCVLMRDTFHVVSLAEMHRLLQNDEMPPPRTVAITFDDCYRDNLYAARVLAEHHLPATFFVPTLYVGTDHVFDWDKHLCPLANLTWDDLKEMMQLGHDIGSHTVSHADLGVAGPEEAYREMYDSKKTLETMMQCPVRWFAYPFGGRNNLRQEYLRLAFELGYDCCFSGHGGFVYPNSHDKVLSRIPVPYFRSLLKLELYLRGGLGWARELKRSAGLFSY